MGEYTINDIKSATDEYSANGQYNYAIEDDTSPAIKSIAAEHDPEGRQLNAGDFFKLLAQREAICKPAEEAACRQTLRMALHMPAEDTSGTKLEFQTIALEDSTQVAITKITPDNLIPGKAAIVFVGGIFAPTALYLHFLQSLAKAEGREIIGISQPGMGGSRLPAGETVTRNLLVDVVYRTIQKTIKPGDHVVIMGHSLGTIPTRGLAKKKTLPVDGPFDPLDGYLGNYCTIDQVILIAPVPGEEERRAGYSTDVAYTSMSGLTLLSGMMIPIDRLGDLTIQNHPGEEKSWIRTFQAGERFPVTMLGMIGNLLETDDEPILSRANCGDRSLPRLSIVLPGDDHLFRLRDGDWNKLNNVYIVPGADHGFVTGLGSTNQWVDDIQAVLRGDKPEQSCTFPANDLDPLFIFSGHGRMMGGMEGALKVSETGAMSAFGGIGVDYDLALHSLLSLRLGADAMVGKPIPSGAVAVPLTGHGDLLVAPATNSHFRLGVGGQGGYEPVQGAMEAPFAYGEIGYNFHDAIDATLMVGTDPTEMTGSAGMLKVRLPGF